MKITFDKPKRKPLKMSKPRPPLISHVDSDKPDMRFGFLAVPRRHRTTFRRQNCAVSVDANFHICDLDRFERQSSDSQVR